MKDFIKSLAFRVMVAAAALLVGMMIYAASTGGVSTIPETVIGTVVTPLQTFFAGVGNSVSRFFGNLTEGGRLRGENEKLQAELNTLRDGQVELDELRRENERLRDYLELSEQNADFRYADARVVAKDPSDNYYNFTINVGSARGVHAGDPVITPEGLVGVVERASANYARVRTILDPETKISAYISRTRDNGITGNTPQTASEGLLHLLRLDRGTGAAKGDYVLTYGSAKYPSGLKIGELTEVFAESDGLSMSAAIRPFANIEKVSDVLVIIGFTGKDEMPES